MREVAGFLLANGMFCAVGLALLHALRLVSLRPLALLAASGLAFVCGIAALGIGSIALLVAGIPFTLPAVLVLALAEIGVCAAGSLVAAHRFGSARPPAAPVLRIGRAHAPVWAAGLALLVLFLIEAVAMRAMPVAFDAAHIWTFKATALTFADHLQPELFDNELLASPSFSGQDYPPLQSVFMSIVFRAMGGPQPDRVPLELWLLSAAFVAALFHLVGRRRGPLALAPGIAAALAAYGSVLLSNADGTVAIYASLGALCWARWLESGQARHALLAGLLLGAAANVKVEGLLFAAAVLASGFVAGWRAKPDRWPAWSAASAAVTAIAILPWRIWLWTQSPPATQPTAPVGDLVNPSWLIDRSDQLRLGARRTIDLLADQERSQWAVAAFLAAAVIAAAAATRRGPALFHLLAFGLSVCAVVGIYWTSLRTDFGFYLDTSVDRVIITPIFLACVGLAHLLPTRERDARPAR